MLGVFCCSIDCNGRRVLLIVKMERSRGFGDGDEGILKRNLGALRILFRLGWII